MVEISFLNIHKGTKEICQSEAYMKGNAGFDITPSVALARGIQACAKFRTGIFMRTRFLLSCLHKGYSENFKKITGFIGILRISFSWFLWIKICFLTNIRKQKTSEKGRTLEAFTFILLMTWPGCHRLSLLNWN